MKNILGIAIALALLVPVAPLALATTPTFYGPTFSVTPSSTTSSTVNITLSTASGSSFTGTPAGGGFNGSSICNPADPSTCTFTLQACTNSTFFYSIHQISVTTPDGDTFWLGGANGYSLTWPTAYGGPANNYQTTTNGFGPAINVTTGDSFILPFGSEAGGFAGYTFMSSLGNPPNPGYGSPATGPTSEGPYYWYLQSTGRIDQLGVNPTASAGTYTVDIEGVAVCGTYILFFDAALQFTLTQVNTPSLSTSSTPSSITLPSTQTVNDTATVSGGSPSLSGTVNFTLYYGTTCTGTPVYTDNGVPLVSGTATSGNAIPSGGWQVGTYTWQVSFNATDLSDNSISAQCGGSGEVLTVIPPTSLATRTPGYWATHYNFTTYVFDHQLGGSIQVGSCLTINDTSDLMGGFWSSISKNSTGGDRSNVPGANYGTNIDQARMQLIQQLLAGILNNAADGSNPTGVTLAQAGTDFCTGNATTILNDVGLLNTFNNSGDNIAFPAGTPGLSLQNISIGGKAAKSLSDFGFWDIMPGDTGYPVTTDPGWS